MNLTVPNMTGYDEVKIIMTSLPVSDEFIFSGLPRLVRIVFRERAIISGLEKGRQLENESSDPIYRFILVNDFSRRIQRHQT